MMNSNPETVSTDYDTSSRLYFEPLTIEDVLNVIEKERPEGIIIQFGGQTPLKLANGIQKFLEDKPLKAASGEPGLLCCIVAVLCCAALCIRLFRAVLLGLEQLCGHPKAAPGTAWWCPCWRATCVLK